MIYLVCFLISIILFHGLFKPYMLAGEQEHRYSAPIGLIVICVLPTVILATFRADTVGTDVMTYVKPYYLYAQKAGSFYAFHKVARLDVLYEIVTYLIARWLPSLCVLHMVNELLVMVPVVISLCVVNETISIPYDLAMISFYFMFYNVSLNVVRQSIACAFFMLGFVYFYNKKYGYSVLFSLLATGFHVTAVFAVSFILFVKCFIVLQKKIGKWVTAAAILTIFIMSFNIERYIKPVIRFFPGVYSTKFNYYIAHKELASGLGETYVVMKVLCIVILIILLKNKYHSDFNSFLLIIQCFSLAMIPFTSKIAYTYRVLRYFDYLSILVFPQIYMIVKKDVKSRFYAFFLVVLVMFMYWGITFYIKNSGGTMPYKLMGL